MYPILKKRPTETTNEAPSASSNICRYHIVKILLRLYVVQVYEVLIHTKS